MNAPHPRLDGITFAQHPAITDSWTVTIDGDTRTITQEGPASFFAWIGFPFRCWSFQGAVDACAEDARHQRFLHDRAEALVREQDRRIGALSPEQFEYVLDCREQELAGLSVNSVGRADMLRADIQAMKDSRARQEMTT